MEARATLRMIKSRAKQFLNLVIDYSVKRTKRKRSRNPENQVSDADTHPLSLPLPKNQEIKTDRFWLFVDECTFGAEDAEVAGRARQEICYLGVYVLRIPEERRKSIT